MQSLLPIEKHKDFTKFTLDYIRSNKFKKTRDSLAERKYTVQDTNNSSRIINHWHKLGILPIGVNLESGKWRKFSTPEIVWNRIALRMRKFGVPLEHITSANKKIMIWDEAQDMYPYFEAALLLAWKSPKDIYVVVWGNGNVDYGAIEEIERHKSLVGNRDKLLISLKGVLEELGVKDVAKPEVLFALNKGELSLLEQIRCGKGKEITIRLNDNNQISHISGRSIQQGNFTANQIKRMTEMNGWYGSLTVQVEDGIAKSMEVITRKRVE